MTTTMQNVPTGAVGSAVATIQEKVNGMIDDLIESLPGHDRFCHGVDTRRAKLGSLPCEVAEVSPDFVNCGTRQEMIGI